MVSVVFKTFIGDPYLFFFNPTFVGFSGESGLKMGWSLSYHTIKTHKILTNNNQKKHGKGTINIPVKLFFLLTVCPIHSQSKGRLGRGLAFNLPAAKYACLINPNYSLTIEAFSLKVSPRNV